MQTQIIIPKLDNDGSDNSDLIADAIRAMCVSFGGATAYDARGFWVNDGGRLFKDDVTVIVSAAQSAEQAEAVRALARRVLRLTDQEAVFVSVGGNAEIID